MTNIDKLTLHQVLRLFNPQKPPCQCWEWEAGLQSVQISCDHIEQYDRMFFVCFKSFLMLFSSACLYLLRALTKEFFTVQLIVTTLEWFLDFGPHLVCGVPGHRQRNLALFVGDNVLSETKKWEQLQQFMTPGSDLSMVIIIKLRGYIVLFMPDILFVWLIIPFKT